MLATRTDVSARLDPRFNVGLVIGDKSLANTWMRLVQFFHVYSRRQRMPLSRSLPELVVRSIYRERVT